MSKEEKDKKELPEKFERKPDKKSEVAEKIWIWCDPSLTRIWLRDRVTEVQQIATTQDAKPVIKNVTVDKGESIVVGKWNGRDMGDTSFPRVDNQPEGLMFKANLPAAYMLTPSQVRIFKDQVDKLNKNLKEQNKKLKPESQKPSIKYDMFKFVKV